MGSFSYQSGEFFAEAVAVQQLAETHGTPLYIYSRAQLEQNYKAWEQALKGTPHKVCYAVKANDNLAVLNVLARLGAGFDIVSGGELERVLRAGGDPSRVVFSGVGKTEAEIERALQVGIYCFNVESENELHRIQHVAEACNIKARISVRVNPDVDAKTHPYISTGLKDNKFGIDINKALPVYQDAARLSHIEVTGIDCHIGSQLTEISPFVDALERLLGLVDKLAAEGIHIQHLDLGGGLGVTYKDEVPPTVDEYVSVIRQRMEGRDMELVFEPGRSIVANAGILLTRVDFLKDNEEHHFAIVDAAMNDLIRPALYGSWHDIVLVKPHNDGIQARYDIVGPVCETSDFLGKGRELNLKTGDLLAVKTAGAYGFVMSSNFNTRNRPAEILVDGSSVHVARRRETLEDQLALETPLPVLD
ncbi:diaminopimelate decarboxylase [Spongorhabdus nitratireducens]